MREIEFRAWDIQGKRMIEWDRIDDLSSLLYDEGRGFYHLMQFTGIHDKSGKCLCEGDIVRTPNGDWGVIQYEAPFFGVTVSATSVSHYTRGWMESCEIIGNIHENPELL